jgi:hypothetical protein
MLEKVFAIYSLTIDEAVEVFVNFRGKTIVVHPACGAFSVLSADRVGTCKPPPDTPGLGMDCVALLAVGVQLRRRLVQLKARFARCDASFTRCDEPVLWEFDAVDLQVRVIALIPCYRAV